MSRPVFQHAQRRRGPRQRHWCFTSFLEHIPAVFDQDIVRYCVYQRETGEAKQRDHFQGYIEFFDPMRMGQIKSILGECHLEPRRGSRHQAREYCRKKASAVPDSQFEFGVWRQDLSRKRKLRDLLLTDMSLDDLIEKDPMSFVRYHKGLRALYHWRQKKKAKKRRKVTVLVLIGPTGSGKTERAAEEPDHFFLPCSDKMWFDGYNGENCLILDDFYGGIKYSHLLRILDGYEIQVPVKTDFVWALWTKVIITSNQEPRNWYKVGLTAALARRLTTIVHVHVRDAPEQYDYLSQVPSFHL